MSIFNQGPALDPAIANHLFEFGVSTRKGSDTSHLGQGLYIVQEKLRDMNASIVCQEHNDGIEFIVSLPIKMPS